MPNISGALLPNAKIVKPAKLSGILRKDFDIVCKLGHKYSSAVIPNEVNM